MTYVRQSILDKRKKIIIFSLVGVLLIILTTVYLFLSKNKEGIAANQGDIISKEQSVISVIRAKREIKAGEIADEMKFEIVSVPKEFVPVGVVATVQQLRNKRVKNTVAENEFLIQSDLGESAELYEEEDRLIEHTFGEGAIPSTVEVGSVVDIKLFRPKNVDDIVVAKTVVIGKVDKTLSFYLNKTEQEHIKEANTEGLIFLVQYLDKSQLASVVTYVPSYDEENSEPGFAAKQRFEDSNN